MAPESIRSGLAPCENADCTAKSALIGTFAGTIWFIMVWNTPVNNTYTSSLPNCGVRASPGTGEAPSEGTLFSAAAFEAYAKFGAGPADGQPGGEKMFELIDDNTWISNGSNAR